MRRSWKTRAIDYAWYIGISLSVVGLSVLLAIYVPDAELASQLWTGILGACLVAGYILYLLEEEVAFNPTDVCRGSCWYPFCYVDGGLSANGTEKAPVASLSLIAEIAVLVSVSERILPDQRRRSSRPTNS